MTDQKDNLVRLGIIGCGVMGKNHLEVLGKVPGVNLTAIADHHAEKRKFAAETYSARAFVEGDELIASGEVDAVIIATPHYSHAPLTIAALERGLHVLCEKPLAVTAKAAQAMIDCAAKHPELVFAAMFQMRLAPIWRKVKAMIEQGAVGELVRMSWTVTNWFRSQAYYDSGDWRATWEGEGGGLLLNQCPHNFDLLCWLLGQPASVAAAQVGLGRRHKIEVEDEVAALLTFPNGAWGSFIASTGEAPGVNRMEIVGDKGTLIIDPTGPTLEYLENETPSQQFLETTDTTMSLPPAHRHRIEVGGKSGGNGGVIANFIAAIREGQPLRSPAPEGILGLELGNAILAAGLEQRPVALPMDRDAYDQLIRRMIAGPGANVAANGQPAGAAV